MKKGMSVLLLLAITSSVIAGEAETPAAFDLPEEAFRLLAESASDPCSICAMETRKKAFQVLNGAFKPGRILKSDNLCQFMRADECGENELSLTCYSTRSPLLTFMFHTAEKHLVGICATDFTEKRFASEYSAAETGTRFEGALEIIEYRYGDGPCYNYYFGENHIQVHCRVLEMKQIEAGLSFDMKAYDDEVQKRLTGGPVSPVLRNAGEVGSDGSERKEHEIGRALSLVFRSLYQFNGAEKGC